MIMIKNCFNVVIVKHYMQIKATIRYHLMLVRMAIIKKSTNNKCWREYGEKGIVLHCWWECKLVQPLWKTVCRFLKKLEIELLGTLREETKIERDTCNPLFIAALFTIARTWKQLGCPSADKWIMEVVVHIDNGILLSYKKRMHLSQL